MSRDELRYKLDELLTLRHRATRANIDAAACQTTADFRRAREADEAYQDGYVAFLDAVAPLPAARPIGGAR